MNNGDNKLFYNNEIQNKPFHAYLLCGKSKEVLSATAKEIAKRILCKQVYKEDCLECLICKQIEENNCVELKIIETEDKNIKIEEISNLKYNFQKKISNKSKRVYIINEVEKLTAKSANAMLKFIEEPEDGTYAIFTTKNIEKVLGTIVSRCRVEYIYFNKESEGNTDYNKEVKKILTNIEKNKINSIYTNKVEIYDSNREPGENIFNTIAEIYLDCLHKKICGRSSEEEEYIIKNNNNEQIIRKIEITDKFSERVKSNTNINLIFDAFIIEISEV